MIVLWITFIIVITYHYIRISAPFIIPLTRAPPTPDTGETGSGRSSTENPVAIIYTIIYIYIYVYIYILVWSTSVNYIIYIPFILSSLPLLLCSRTILVLQMFTYCDVLSSINDSQFLSGIVYYVS